MLPLAGVRFDRSTGLTLYSTRCDSSPVLYYGRMSSIVPDFTMASDAVAGDPHILRLNTARQILLLLTAIVFMYGALGALVCAYDNGNCERSSATSDSAPFTPLSFAHCHAHCPDVSTLLPAVRVLPDIVVSLTILGTVGTLLIRQTSFPPLTPPPRFAPASR
jgi:hypothetical protein